MRVIIFGAGRYYLNRKEQIPRNIKIVAFIDNNCSLQGGVLHGIKIYSPADVFDLTFDQIILMSADTYRMKLQLLHMGVDRAKILSWKAFCALQSKGKYQLFGEIKKKKAEKNVLIISNNLNHSGAPMGALYAAIALKKRGISVLVMSDRGLEPVIQEFLDNEIPVVIYPTIPYLSQDDVTKMLCFDAVLVNVFPMIQCACEISKKRPVLWWIHESSAKYTPGYSLTLQEFDNYDDPDKMKRINAVAVSRIAQHNFNYYYPNKVRTVMNYGIPDSYDEKSNKASGSKIIFAIIGGISCIKGQKYFVEAISHLTAQERSEIECWIIGRVFEDDYYESVKGWADNISCIKLLGEMTRAEMRMAYHNIDVVVCASLEETMSMTITEGMMYGKICITTDETGIAEYIDDGQNGFVCKAGDAIEISKKMRYIIHHRKERAYIGSQARKTYERYFTIDIFGKNLELIIDETIAKYKNETF